VLVLVLAPDLDLGAGTPKQMDPGHARASASAYHANTIPAEVEVDVGAAERSSRQTHTHAHAHPCAHNYVALTGVRVQVQAHTLFHPGMAAAWAGRMLDSVDAGVRAGGTYCEALGWWYNAVLVPVPVLVPGVVLVALGAVAALVVGLHSLCYLAPAYGSGSEAHMSNEHPAPLQNTQTQHVHPA
jgi:hypothetical protein